MNEYNEKQGFCSAEAEKATTTQETATTTQRQLRTTGHFGVWEYGGKPFIITFT